MSDLIDESRTLKIFSDDDPAAKPPSESEDIFHDDVLMLMLPSASAMLPTTPSNERPKSTRSKANSSEPREKVGTLAAVERFIKFES